jgi:NitT/TauT family transport system substrate-binding protein
MVNAIDRYKKYKMWKTTPVVEEAAIDRLQDLLVASGVLENGKRVKSSTLVVNDFAKQVK